MFSLKDLLDLLDRWPSWKRVKEAPDRIDELEKRLAALEHVTPEQAGDPCPFCGKPALRLISQVERTLGRMHVGFTETWKCSECGQSKKVSTNV